MSKAYVIIEKETNAIQTLIGVSQGLLAIYDTQLNAEADIEHRDKGRIEAVPVHLISEATANNVREALECLQAAISRLDTLDPHPMPSELRNRMDLAIAELLERFS